MKRHLHLFQIQNSMHLTGTEHVPYPYLPIYTQRYFIFQIFVSLLVHSFSLYCESPPPYTAVNHLFAVDSAGISPCSHRKSTPRSPATNLTAIFPAGADLRRRTPPSTEELRHRLHRIRLKTKGRLDLRAGL